MMKQTNHIFVLLLDPVNLSIFVFLHFRNNFIVRERSQLLDSGNGDFVIETTDFTFLDQIIVDLPEITIRS